ncbi:ATP-binding protein [Pseudorhodoferax sp.]|uniref:ATP-binding protein n=1 Tax=Pseudorhodoferax sp. TaxID=1993553 RepID=UPI002DD66AE1|nr:ATP-binding protein [Pseudorhodoferax sp.]
MRAWRLRTHLSALLLATMGLAFAVIVVSGMVWRLPQLERDSQRQLRQQTRDVAARIELLLGARQSRLGLLAGVLGGDADSDSAVLQAEVGPGQDFQALYLLSAQGVVRAVGQAGGADLIAPGRDLAANPLFAAVHGGRGTAWSGDPTALPSGASSVGLAYRRPDGLVLIGELPLAFLHEVLQTVAGHDTAEVWVVDQGGTILADTEQGRDWAQLPPGAMPLLQAARASAAVPNGFRIGTRRLWAAVAESEPLGWFFIGRAPAGWDHPAVRELLPYAAAVFGGCLAVGLWIAAVWARRMGRSLRDIVARAAQTTAGQASGQAWPRGSVIEFNAISSDLEGLAAALHERQQKFRAIFNALPIPMAVTDVDNGRRTLDVNDAWCSVFGHRREDVLGLTGAEIGLFSPEQRAWMHEQVRGDSTMLEHHMLRKDGQALPMRSFCRRVRLPHANWMVWASVDVTALRSVERELRELNQQLERRVEQRTQALSDANTQLARQVQQLRLVQDGLVHAEKMAALGALVAGVAHELNTPLGNGVMAASALGDAVRHFRGLAQAGLRRADLQQLTDAVAQGVDIAQRNLRRAIDLVQSFKQVAVDQTSSQRRRFELSEVVHEIVVSLRPSFNRTPYRIEVAVPETGLLLDSYPGALGQTLANLIQNAVLHGFDGRGHGTVRIAAGRGADDEPVWLHVQDDGKGIAPEHIDRIFEPFMTTRMGRGGTGLGLHISYNAVVNVLGGTLAVQSQPGQGSRFVLRIPSEAPLSVPQPLEPLP